MSHRCRLLVPVTLTDPVYNSLPVLRVSHPKSTLRLCETTLWDLLHGGYSGNSSKDSSPVTTLTLHTPRLGTFDSDRHPLRRCLAPRTIVNPDVPRPYRRRSTMFDDPRPTRCRCVGISRSSFGPLHTQTSGPPVLLPFSEYHTSLSTCRLRLTPTMNLTYCLFFYFNDSTDTTGQCSSEP